MKLRPARLLPLAVGPLCALALAAPASATALHHAGAAASHAAADRGRAPSSMAGYFTGSSGLNLVIFSYDSAGGSVSATSVGPGQYGVTFGGLGGITGGHAEVTSGNARATCSVESWGPAGSDLFVVVDCYNFSGNPLDNVTFSLIVTQPRTAPRGMLAYDWIQFPARSYPLTGQYQYNSTGHRNRIKHLGTGRYQVTMPGAGRNTGTGAVKVSAYGAGGGDCLLRSWAGVRGSIVSEVDCYSASGARQDRQFDIVFARGNNLMGRNSLTDANAFAGKPATGLYQPRIQYDSHRGARVSVALLTKGEYFPLFTGSQGRPGNLNGGGGNVEVTPVSSGYVHCSVTDFMDEFTPFATVSCVDNSEHAVNSRFDIQWVTA